MAVPFPTLVDGFGQGIDRTNASGSDSGQSGGAFAAKVDGSVEFLRTTIGPAVLRALRTRSGGEPAAEPGP